ncbi:hypothetical protein JL722_15201 [Aureococcus anophagefferens]|nr:hypothetical protein JL722_15201 [Aureococcus anophagefferens]
MSEQVKRANRRQSLNAMLRVEGFDVVDWNGGAGNGLGTLYAWRKACALAKAKGRGDLAAELAAGTVAAAVYHTAGKGTRLAPLPGAENNNKPGVKLPVVAPLGAQGAAVPLTILESVVKQTGVYAASRKGRLSVFWGDQIFIPTLPATYAPRPRRHPLHARAHARRENVEGPGLEKYGLVAVGKSGAACQIEKFLNACVAPDGSALVVDDKSCLSDVRVAAGTCHKSVAAAVTAGTVELDGAVLVNVTASVVAAPGAIAYNVVEDGPRARGGEVVTDVFMEDGTKHRQRSTTAVDGGKAWKEAVEGNKFSFEQVYKMNLATDVSKTADLAAAAHADLAAVLLAKNLAVQ